jgi:hypothetical protein
VAQQDRVIAEIAEMIVYLALLLLPAVAVVEAPMLHKTHLMAVLVVALELELAAQDQRGMETLQALPHLKEIMVALQQPGQRKALAVVVAHLQLAVLVEQTLAVTVALVPRQA